MVEGNIILWVISAVFILTAITQFFYYLFFYLAPLSRKIPERKGSGKGVSVIICARNEAENLEKFLPSVLEQNYNDYEVIVVNDCSEDNSDIILGRFKQKYEHLKVSNINKDPKFTHFKKFAMFIGIKAASNELLLFTDADCMPVSNNWITTMVSGFEDGKDIVLGYGGYFSEKKLLNRYIRYDTITIAMQYFGMAKRGIPYMGVGRNLAYRRSFFFNKRGFGDHSNLISGDDDLFVSENGNKENVAIELRKDSFTRSLSAPLAKKWLAQKRRHFTTAPHYKAGTKAILILEPLSRVFFYSSFITLISCQFYWEFILGIFGLRLIVQLIVYILSGKMFAEKNIAPVSLFFDIFSPLINGMIYITNRNRKNRNIKWK